MKALLRKKNLLVIILVLLVITGVITHINPFKKVTTYTKEVYAIPLAYNCGSSGNADFAATVSVQNAPNRQQTYSNLDFTVTFKLSDLKNVNNDDIKISKVYYGNRTINQSNNGTTNYSYKVNKVWKYYGGSYHYDADNIVLSIKGTNGAFYEGDLKIDVYVGSSKTKNRRKCNAKTRSYTIHLVGPYYHFEGNFNQKSELEGNPNNEENEWVLAVDSSKTYPKNGFDFSKIQAKIYNENNEDVTWRFNINNNQYLNLVSIKNRTDDWSRPAAGKYKVVFNYNNPNFSVAREGNVEKLEYVYEGDDGITLGNKRLYWTNDMSSSGLDVKSYRYSPTNETVTEEHTIEIQYIKNGNITWTDSYTDPNFGNYISKEYTKTKAEFDVMYADYQNIDISNLVSLDVYGDNSYGWLAIPIDVGTEEAPSTALCYLYQHRNANNFWESDSYNYWCINESGGPSAFSWDMFDNDDRNILLNGKDLGVAGRYVPQRRYDSYWNDNISYTYQMHYTRTIRKVIEDRSKINVPLATDGGAYYFLYRYKRDVINNDELNNPELKIFKEDTEEEFDIPGVFRVNWNTDPSLNNRWYSTGDFYSSKLSFDIRYFDDSLPSGTRAEQIAGTYYLSIKFNNVDEQRVYFTITDGIVDFYVQSSVDRHESTNHLKEGEPPTNMYYEWNIGFFLMRAGSIAKTKSARTISVHIYDRQIKLKDDLFNGPTPILDNDGVLTRELNANDFEYFDSVNYTIKILNYDKTNGTVTFAAKEEADNGFDSEVTLYNSYDENDNVVQTYTKTLQEMNDIYGAEAMQTALEFFKYRTNGTVVENVLEGNIQILYTMQVEAQVVNDVEVPGGNRIYYTKDGVQYDRILMDATTSDDFASIAAEETAVYAKIAKYLQFTEADAEGKSYLEYGVISGVRKTLKDVNGHVIEGNEVTELFDIFVDPSETNIEKPVSITPKEDVEINPGVYYVYIGTDNYIGAGYVYPPTKGSIPAADYPEMMNVNIHEAKIIYDPPRYSPRLQDPQSSNSGNDQQRMYYNANSESKIMLEMGDIKFFDNGTSGVAVNYKYEFLPYDDIHCENVTNQQIPFVVENPDDPEHPQIIYETYSGPVCTDTNGDPIETSSLWNDITNTAGQYITIDPTTYINDDYIHHKDVYGNETTPYIYVRNLVKEGAHAGEFSPKGYYRITYYYQRTYQRRYSVVGSSFSQHSETVQGLDPNTGRYGTSTILSNVSKFYGIEIYNTEPVEFVHNFRSTKIIEGSLNYISNPTSIQIGGKFTDSDGEKHTIVAGTADIKNDSGVLVHNVPVLKFINSQNQEEDLFMQYRFLCKYGDEWEPCINVKQHIQGLDEDDPDYIKYKPYEDGGEALEFRIELENTKDFDTRKMITPEGTYDIELTYEEVEEVTSYETVEESTAVVTANFSALVSEDSFSFLITNQKAVLSEDDQYIEIGISTQYIFEEDLGKFEAAIYDPGTDGAYTNKISDQYDEYGRCNEILCLEDPLIEWVPHDANSDPDRFEGVLRIHINPDRINDIRKDTYYQLQLEYDYLQTGKRSYAQIDIKDLLSWKILEDYPMIAGLATLDNNEVIQLNELYRNIENSTIDLEIDSPHTNNVSVFIIPEITCPGPAYNCFPRTYENDPDSATAFFGAAETLNTDYFNIINTSGTDGHITLTYHRKPSDNSMLDKGDFLIVLYYSDGDKKVVPFTAYDSFVRIGLNATRSYTTVSGVAHKGLFINKDGDLTADVQIFGIDNLNDIRLKIMRSGSNAVICDDTVSSKACTRTDGPFRFYKSEITTNPKKFHLKYQHGKNLDSGKYIVQFNVVGRDTSVAPLVKWVDEPTTQNQLEFEIKEKYFDFDFYRNNANPPVYLDPEIEPEDGLIPNKAGKLVYKIKTDDIVNDNNPITTVMNQIKNSINIIHLDTQLNYKSSFTTTVERINDYDFKLTIQYAKDKVPKGTYEISLLYSREIENEETHQVSTTTIERTRQFTIGDEVKYITLSNQTIVSNANDGLLHNNLRGTVTARYSAGAYPLDMNYFTLQVMNSSNEVISDDIFVPTITGNYVSVRYDPNAGRVPAGEYKLVVTYTENPLHPVVVESPFTMYAAYNEFEISNMQTTSSMIYADREGQKYEFTVNDTYFNNDQKRALKARVYDSNNKLVYSDFASDNDKFASAEERKAAFTMTNTVRQYKTFTIGINAYKAQVGQYFIQLFLDEPTMPEWDYYVSNKLAFSIDGTENEITISGASKITPIRDLAEDGTIFDMDGAHVKALFYPSTGFEDLSFVTLQLYKDDTLVQTYDQNSGNFQIVQDSLHLNNVQSEFDTGELEAGHYRLGFCLHGLIYNTMEFDVVHYIPATSITVTIGGQNLTSNPFVNRTETPNVVVTLQPSNATLKHVHIVVANMDILTMTDTKLTPKASGSTLVTISSADITVSGTISVVDGLSSTKYEVVQGKNGANGYIFIKNLAGNDRNGIKLSTILANINNKKPGYKVKDKSGKDIASSALSTTNGTTNMTIINGDGSKYTLLIKGDALGTGAIKIGSVGKVYRNFKKTDTDHLWQNALMFKVINVVDRDDVLKINDVGVLYRFFKGTQTSI